MVMGFYDIVEMLVSSIKYGVIFVTNFITLLPQYFTFFMGYVERFIYVNAYYGICIGTIIIIAFIRFYLKKGTN